ncbi:recombinase family protein [Chitinophaga japonensis]|uniref:DNA invertase Pin-like site-specific DNA recombinase n=1 Tax=Chitinophaga japonensis TaxID=104662 RepID=A0A562TBC0_CHIJA|nr:recombinase family protein [Chitinophaga japonensis]TWI90897.1 DNA invertase Pin-like site-specific DNA recombinase [Chitinophaga japonensis]
MRIADLYIRVSTDEQAEKGYSQRNQEEMLRRYCEIHAIQVRRVIFEDHSAKTFGRPEWQKLLSDLRKRRGQTDVILFTKWDRFSRNAGDAYQMISILAKLGVDVQAIEQPLDLTIPENKMMLAIYLAAPEVENDRRALNTFFGMRRAKKEGRWMGTAPIGYINKVTDDGKKKYIAPKYPDADILRWAFETVAKGIFTTEQVWKQVKQKGLKVSKNGFWIIIRNPVYCGKIFIRKYKEEEAHFVKGQHEPIISEALFYEVQDVLDGRRKQRGTQIVVHDDLPLRGFLICPRCGQLLTGSASRGKYRYYHYYHCTSSCGCRYNADNANKLFVVELKKLVPHPGMAEIYKSAIIGEYDSQTQDHMDGYRGMLERLEELNKELAKARRLMLKEEITAAEYREIKTEYQPEINSLEARLSNYTAPVSKIDGLVNKAVDNVSKLDCLFEEGTIVEKREIVSSIYPEKLTFDGFNYRTPRLNEAVRLICAMDAAFRQKEKGHSSKFSEMSPEVTP